MGSGQHMMGQQNMDMMNQMMGEMHQMMGQGATTLEAIEMLHEDGIKIVMLTGDSRTTAQAVARKLGLDEWWPRFSRTRRRRKSKNCRRRA